MEDFSMLFRQLAGLRVAVVGDIMLDTYLWGAVDRISPEAPVPVVSVRQREHRIGGAGNVALNARALGAYVSLISVTGEDEEAGILLHLLEKEGVNCKGVIRSAARPTTTKTRVISRNQQMLRLDQELTRDLDESEETGLLQAFQQCLKEVQPQVVIFEDYNKGVLTATSIRSMLDACRQEGILTAVDPKQRNFFAYQGVDIFKPNLKEVKEALHRVSLPVGLPELREVHQELQQRLAHRISLITLSEKGVFYQQGEEAALLPTHVRQIADVSGAGDTVIAVAALVYAATGDLRQMAEIANLAGGLVCEEVGTVAINPQRLLEECNSVFGR